MNELTMVLLWQRYYMDRIMLFSSYIENNALRKNFVENYPHENLVMECVSSMLLSKDWEYLSSLHDTRVGFTEVSDKLSRVSQYLRQYLNPTNISIYSL